MFNYVLGVLSDPEDVCELEDAINDSPANLIAFAESIDECDNFQLPLFEFGKRLEKNGIGRLEGNCFTIFDQGRQQYFAKKRAEFTAVLEDIRLIGTQKFQNKGELDELMDALRKAYEDPFDIYIKLDSEDAEPLDAFLRRAERDTPYYICAAVEYRY